jgi:hypothetical protein
MKERRAEATPEWYTEEAVNPPYDPVAMLFKDAAEADFPVPRPADAITEEELLSKQRQDSQPKRKEPVKITMETASGVKNFPQASLLDSFFASVTPPSAKPTPAVVEDFEETYSNIDKEYEAKLKAAAVEDETMPEWDEPTDTPDLPKMPDRSELQKEKIEYPAYKPVKFPNRLMQEQLAIGNPFAPLVAMDCTPDAEDLLCPPAHSPANDKTWYYKDPNYATQGPFDSIQMFNWYTAGFFKPDLPLSTSSRGPFIPLSMYCANRYPNYMQYSIDEALQSEPPKTVLEVERQQSKWSVPFTAKRMAAKPGKSSEHVGAKPRRSQACETETSELKHLLGVTRHK